MSEETTTTLAERFHIEISNTERRNSSISIQDCYIVYLIECRSVSVSKDLSFTKKIHRFRPKISTGQSSICVFRRYSDFETLRNYLIAKYSWVIVPVLPEKTVTTLICVSSLCFFLFVRSLIHGRNLIKIERVSKLLNVVVFYSK